MKDIQLCGLGNGLVDLQYQVSDEQFVELSLPKGEMILFDQVTQAKMLNRFDFAKAFKVSGGSAANTVVAFAGLGGKAAYKTVLGNDELGEFYAAEFEKLGIELRADKLVDESTGTCIIFITPDSERTLHTCLAATSKFGVNNIYEEIIARSEWLYIEGYKFSEVSSTEAIYKAVQTAKVYGTKIAVTFSDKFIVDFHKNGLEKVVENADLVFCNEPEALAYVGTDEVESAFEGLKKASPNVALTLGNEGSLVHWQGKDYRFPSLSVKSIDTTGAGDSYAGAFLYGVVVEKDIELAGKLAAYTAGKVVAQMGPRLTTDIKQFIEESKLAF
jgi:sugar/nucleoside kinase (ribokinase family)